jgi:diguanylate cyclase (GGDEF)-like protein
MTNILVVEEVPLVAGVLKEALEAEGCHIISIPDGKAAVKFALCETPQLIILDMMVRGMDGYGLIRQLRNHWKSMHIPVIVLSSLDEPANKVRAFEEDIDDYITKPFDKYELLARIRRTLRRGQQIFLSPLTGLPAGLQVERAINHKHRSSDTWSILYLDLDDFKAFNDVYGFLTGNEMIRLVGRICQHIVCEYGNADDFVGHIGGDDFVIVTTPDRAQMLSQHIIESYREESKAFYRPEDLKRGTISGVDRKGRPYQFPLVSLSIGVLHDKIRPHNIREVSYLAAEAKCQAKQSTNNIYSISSPRDIPYHTPSHSVSFLSSHRILTPGSFSFAALNQSHFVEETEVERQVH